LKKRRSRVGEEAQSCLDTLARKQIERELTDVQRGIEANPKGTAMTELLDPEARVDERLALRARTIGKIRRRSEK